MASDQEHKGHKSSQTFRLGTATEHNKALPMTVVAASNGSQGGPTGTTVSGPLGRSTTEWSGQLAKQTYEWPPLQGEGNVLDALHRLRDTLNERAGKRIWAGERVVDKPDMDGWLVPSGERTTSGAEPPDGALCCEVTRAERLSQRQRVHGKVVREDDLADLADMLVAGVLAKESEAHRDIVLILDANDAPAFTDRGEIVEEVRSRMTGQSIGNRWAQIWLVGPTTRLTMRLV